MVGTKLDIQKNKDYVEQLCLHLNLPFLAVSAKNDINVELLSQFIIENLDKKNLKFF